MPHSSLELVQNLVLPVPPQAALGTVLTSNPCASATQSRESLKYYIHSFWRTTALQILGSGCVDDMVVETLLLLRPMLVNASQLPMRMTSFPVFSTAIFLLENPWVLSSLGTEPIDLGRPLPNKLADWKHFPTSPGLWSLGVLNQAICFDGFKDLELRWLRGVFFFNRTFTWTGRLKKNCPSQKSGAISYFSNLSYRLGVTCLFWNKIVLDELYIFLHLLSPHRFCVGVGFSPWCETSENSELVYLKKKPSLPMECRQISKKTHLDLFGKIWSIGISHCSFPFR